MSILIKAIVVKSINQFYNVLSKNVCPVHYTKQIRGLHVIDVVTLSLSCRSCHENGQCCAFQRSTDTLV